MSDIIDYSQLYTKKGGTYTNIVQWSHYNDPIDRSNGRLAGNSRIWGDAPIETQKAVIDSLGIVNINEGFLR